MLYVVLKIVYGEKSSGGVGGGGLVLLRSYPPEELSSREVVLSSGELSSLGVVFREAVLQESCPQVDSPRELFSGDLSSWEPSWGESGGLVLRVYILTGELLGGGCPGGVVLKGICPLCCLTMQY